MTAQEARAAYLGFCATTKGFQIQWTVTQVQIFTCGMAETAVAKVAEVIPLSDTGTSIHILRVDLVPNWEGYVEWLSVQ